MSNEANLDPAATQLGDAFFERVETEEREHLSLRTQELEARDSIAEATGIHDEQLLAELTGLGIRVETLSALTLIPLVAVAWSDGEMDEAERECALTGAASAGIEPGSVAHRLFEIWLQEAPPPDLTNLWREFTRALCKGQTREETARLREKLLGRAREVAAVAGDTRNRTPHVSFVEEECLAKLSRAFKD